MNKALADLIKISNATGKDSTLVQGGGGNTSVKTADGKYMFIKASGTALKDMNSRRGWRRLRLERVLSIINDKSIAKLSVNKREIEVVNRLLDACDDKVATGARPSVESHLHAFLDKCIIHLHPIAVAAYVNSKNGRKEFERLFKQIENQKSKIKNSLPPLWVPYADPGFMLAKKIANLVTAYQKQSGRKPAILFLEKHGLFISTGTAAKALQLVREVIRLCKSKLPAVKSVRIKTPAVRDITAAKSAIGKAVLNETGQNLPASYFKTTKLIAAFMARKDAAKLLNTPALNPDELVYANGSALWIENYDVKTITGKLKSLVRKRQKPASAFIIKDVGLFVAAEKKIAPTIAEITAGSLLVRMYATKFGGILTLNKRQQDFINTWEAEAFRRKVATRPCVSRRKSVQRGK